jgi:transposase
MKKRQSCPTDLSDDEWAVLEPLIPPPQEGATAKCE